jgi:hypothetical protein
MLCRIDGRIHIRAVPGDKRPNHFIRVSGVAILIRLPAPRLHPFATNKILVQTRTAGRGHFPSSKLAQNDASNLPSN